MSKRSSSVRRAHGDTHEPHYDQHGNNHDDVFSAASVRNRVAEDSRPPRNTHFDQHCVGNGGPGARGFSDPTCDANVIKVPSLDCDNRSPAYERHTFESAYERHTFESDLGGWEGQRDGRKREPDAQSDDMVFEDVDIDDAELQTLNSLPLSSKKSAVMAKSKQLPLVTCRSLNLLLLGQTRKPMSNAWLSQGLAFHPSQSHAEVAYGLVQNRGGPCGLLAAIQAALLTFLLFDRERGVCTLHQGASSSDIHRKLAALGDDAKQHALACVLAKIIWRSRARKSTGAVIATVGGDQTLSGVVIDGLVTTEYDTEANLLDAIKEKMPMFQGERGAILFLCSVVLTRGIETVMEDMDEQAGNPLIGTHSYCTQEMVNLLMTGIAASNVHNGSLSLDGGRGEPRLVLKGINKKSDIGFLSLFEYYGSMEVGSNMKAPRYPVWVICSESHFSVLFACNRHITGRHRTSFDLYYYDMLANQNEKIRLTITPAAGGGGKSSGTSRPDYCGNNDDDELVPPINHCIHTCWHGADIDWNETDPLL